MYSDLEYSIRKRGFVQWGDKRLTLADISTILPKEVKNGIVPEIAQRKRLSAIDIRTAKELYKCAECGRTYLDEEAAFTSPEYHIKSTNRIYRCEWRNRVMDEQRIRLIIADLDGLQKQLFRSS